MPSRTGRGNASDRPRAASGARGPRRAATNRLGAPMSPSHFGISYSRIRWSRNVLQVRSDDEPVVLVQVVAMVGKHQVGRDVGLDRSKHSLTRRRRRGSSSRGSRPTPIASRAPSRSIAARGLGLSRAAPASSRTTHVRQRPAGRSISRRRVPPQPISMSSQWAPRQRTRRGCARRGRDPAAEARSLRVRLRVPDLPWGAARACMSSNCWRSLKVSMRRPEALVTIAHELRSRRSGARTARRPAPRRGACSRRSRRGRRSSRR